MRAVFAASTVVLAAGFAGSVAGADISTLAGPFTLVTTQSTSFPVVSTGAEFYMLPL
jgi:hypothetical protein